MLSYLSFVPSARERKKKRGVSSTTLLENNTTWQTLLQINLTTQYFWERNKKRHERPSIYKPDIKKEGMNVDLLKQELYFCSNLSVEHWTVSLLNRLRIWTLFSGCSLQILLYLFCLTIFCLKLCVIVIYQM